MLAFRLFVDGKALGDMGVANSAVASVRVGMDRVKHSGEIECRLYVGGLTEPDAEDVCRFFRWACPQIQVGSRLEIELVDSENCVPPTKLYRNDDAVQESSFTEEEIRELRRQDYLALKKEFEP